jgi:hypothetical protein
MKNNSTRSALDSSLTIGIDLSDKYSQVCMLDAQGEVMAEGRVRTTEAALSRRFATLAPCRDPVLLSPVQHRSEQAQADPLGARASEAALTGRCARGRCP